MPSRIVMPPMKARRAAVCVPISGRCAAGDPFAWTRHAPVASASMPRRIDVELTSTRPDGTWTWRAAGARQPEGDLDGALLYPGAKIGDGVRADADFDIDGITITAVAPPAGERSKPELLEIIGPPRRDDELVTTTLVGKGGRGRDDR